MFKLGELTAEMAMIHRMDPGGMCRKDIRTGVLRGIDMNMNAYVTDRHSQIPSEEGNNIELYRNLLQPHFLFNSLNNLYALSLKRSEQTPEAIAGLSLLLEKVVRCSRMELIPLSEEVELIESYIALEKIWLKDSFLMDFQIKGDTREVAIPPLTVYTLVENAFKHGIRKCGQDGWITLHLVVKSDKIMLKVRNSVMSVRSDGYFQPVSGSGLGIEAVRRLLDDSYHKNYFLNARPIGDVYAVDLIIGSVAA